MTLTTSTTALRTTRLDGVLADDDVVDLDTATNLIRSTALRDSPVGPVGLEIEGHVHHRDDPLRPLSYEQLDDLATALTPLPYGGRVTLEPGGQVEVSSAVHPDTATAIAATRAETALVQQRLAELGLTWTFRGSDPWRAPTRIHPGERYAGMEAWFDGCAGGGVPGRTMMCSTAALQVNLEAGRPDQWADRVRRAVRLGPLLTALSGSSRWLSGRDTGLRSARQHAWSSMDPRIGGPLRCGDDPVGDWTEHVLDAPVLHLDGPTGLRPVDRCRSLAEWLIDPADWPAPTAADVRRQLTTQFPPVRLRGFLELRCLDALPEPWWPAVVEAVVTWMDDDRAHASVDAAIVPVADRWVAAYTDGLADPALRQAAVSCLETATLLNPNNPNLTALLGLAREGRSPGDLLPDPTPSILEKL